MTKKVIAIVAAVIVAGLAAWGIVTLRNKNSTPTTVTTPTEIVEVVETPTVAPTAEPVG